MGLLDTSALKAAKLKGKITQALAKHDIDQSEQVLQDMNVQEERNAKILQLIDQTRQTIAGMKPPELPDVVPMPSRGQLAAVGVNALLGGGVNQGINQAMQVAGLQEERDYKQGLQQYQSQGKMLEAQMEGLGDQYQAGIRNEQSLGQRYDRIQRDQATEYGRSQTALGAALSRYQSANSAGEKQAAAVEANRIAETMGVGQVIGPDQLAMDLQDAAMQQRDRNLQAANKFNSYVEGIRRTNGQLTEADLAQLEPMRQELIRQGVPENLMPDPSKEVTLAKQRLEASARQFNQMFGLRKEAEARRAAETQERLRIAKDNLALARERFTLTKDNADWDRVVAERSRENAAKKELTGILRTELSAIEKDLSSANLTLRQYEREASKLTGNEKIAAQAKVDAQKKVVSDLAAKKATITNKLSELRTNAEEEIQASQVPQGGGGFTDRVLAFAQSTARGKDIDCSKFTQAFFRSSGVELPGTAVSQYRHIQQRNAFVKRPDVAPGDLVFFDNGLRTSFNTKGKAISKGVYANHVGIVSRVENGQIFVVDDSAGRAPKERPLGSKYRVLGFGRPV